MRRKAKSSRTPKLWASRAQPAVAASTGLLSLAAVCAPLLTNSSYAAEPAFGFTKPAWLTDLSLSAKESYDDNVFLVSGDGAKKRDSMVTSVSPKIGANLAPLLGKDSVLQALAFGYAPDFATYHNAASESYNAHRFATTLKGKADAFTFNLENGFNYIDGSTDGPIYAPPDVISAYATAAPRERREQFQDRAKLVMQYDWDRWFVRPSASLLYYDLMTEKRAIPGYQNYSDRYDVNGGADLGYKVSPEMAMTLAYRYGHQYQEQFSEQVDPAHLSSPSDYQRVLLGVEGKPWKWLTFSAQGGPDFRSYEPDTPTHTTPVSDKHPIKYYGEAGVTTQITSQDTLAFKYKQWQWVSSVGKLPIFDSLYDLSYRRKLTAKLSLELGGRIQSADYTSGDTASSARDDWQYTASIGLAYSFTPNLSANLAYAIDLGRNAQDNLVAPQYREFDHNLVTLGLLWKF